jgi:co-chaperonin GroES (HSP10)
MARQIVIKFVKKKLIKSVSGYLITTSIQAERQDALKVAVGTKMSEVFRMQWFL